MSVKVRFALVFCVLLLILVDRCQASGGQDGDEGFLKYLYTLQKQMGYFYTLSVISVALLPVPREFT